MRRSQLCMNDAGCGFLKCRANRRIFHLRTFEDKRPENPFLVQVRTEQLQPTPYADRNGAIVNILKLTVQAKSYITRPLPRQPERNGFVSSWICVFREARKNIFPTTTYNGEQNYETVQIKTGNSKWYQALSRLAQTNECIHKRIPKVLPLTASALPRLNRVARMWKGLPVCNSLRK